MVVLMAKRMTKTQAKRAYMAINQKARKLWWARGWNLPRELGMSTKDMMAIETICEKYLKKF
jgi:hypothetical protein